MTHQATYRPPYCDEHLCTADKCQRKEHVGDIKGACQNCGLELTGALCRTNGMVHTVAGCNRCEAEGVE